MSILNEAGNWASIISLAISVLTFLLVGSLRSKIIEMRRKNRVRALVSDIRTIPDDAIPLSSASISKLESLGRNLPKGWLFWCSNKSKSARDTQNAIKENNLSSVKESMEDWLSYSEDL